VLVLLARDLRVAPAEVTWLGSAFGTGLLLVGATGSRLLRRGTQPALRTGAVVFSVGAIMLAFASSEKPAIAGALLFGLGAAALVLVTPVLLQGPGAAARLSRSSAAASAAGVMAPFSLGALDALTGNGRIGLLAIVAPLAMLAVSARRRGSTSRSTPRGRPRAWSSVVAARWALVVLAVSCEFCFILWAVARLEDTGLRPALAAIVSCAFPVGMAVGRLVGPRLFDRVPIVPLGAAITAAGTLIVVVADVPSGAAAGLAVAGVGVATLYPVTLTELTTAPGLAPGQGAALGAVASGVAILASATALDAIGDAVELRLVFLLNLLVLAALTTLHVALSSSRR
jgi:predicted MFS family arabinose efflux permease